MQTSETFSRIWSAFDEGQIVATCAWCGRVWIDEAWVSPPAAALAAVDTRYVFSHSICDACCERAGRERRQSDAARAEKE